MGPYRLSAFRASGRAAYTNKAVVAQYRGAGRPEACFALERSLDHAARELGISPVEIRRRNLPDAGELPYPRPLPYRDGVQIVYDGGDYAACLEACLDLLPESEADTLAREHPYLRVGYGVATYIEATGRGPYESGRVTLRPGGTFEVAAGSASAGQGHDTTFAQVAADALCVDVHQVTVVDGDTDAVADGIGTFASRSAVMAGNAVHLAATRLVARARELAARHLGVDLARVLLDGAGFRAEAAEALTWQQLAAELRPGGGLGNRPLLEEVARYEVDTVTWTMGAHAAVVGVDPETGLCTVLRYAVAHEGGTDINPLIVEGQIIGGAAQGIGGALLESFGYDTQGQPTSGTLAEYLLPGACDVPNLRVRHLHVPTGANPLGVRGAGESGTIAAYAAVVSAVEAAVGDRVGHIRGTPLDPAVLAVGRREPVAAQVAT
jgi:carbon-monoxide dehydrogenase large subunit